MCPSINSLVLLVIYQHTVTFTLFSPTRVSTYFSKPIVSYTLKTLQSEEFMLYYHTL